MFDQDDYKAILQARLEAGKQVRGYRRKLSEALGVHTSFISQVINSHIHITPDHAAALAEFWTLDESESEYFLTLVSLARASSRAYKNYLAKRVTSLQQKRKSVTNRIKPAKLVTEDPATAIKYYSSWHLLAIHVLVTIPGFQTAPAIADKLHLGIETVLTCLRQLEDLNLLQKGPAGYKAVETNMHLPADSPLIFSHHGSWRNYTVSRMALHGDQGTHYTSLMGISRKDYEKLREHMLKFIADSRQIAIDSKEEDLFCLCMDLYPV